MNRYILLGAMSLGLAGCGASQIATVASVLTGTIQAKTAAEEGVAAGQLFCSVATADGPIVTAIVDAADAKAVTVTGKAAAFVASVCAVINGIPVSPPAAPNAAPITAVVVPTA